MATGSGAREPSPNPHTTSGGETPLAPLGTRAGPKQQSSGMPSILSLGHSPSKPELLITKL